MFIAMLLKMVREAIENEITMVVRNASDIRSDFRIEFVAQEGEDAYACYTSGHSPSGTYKMEQHSIEDGCAIISMWLSDMNATIAIECNE